MSNPTFPRFFDSFRQSDERFSDYFYHFLGQHLAHCDDCFFTRGDCKKKKMGAGKKSTAKATVKKKKRIGYECLEQDASTKLALHLPLLHLVVKRSCFMHGRTAPGAERCSATRREGNSRESKHEESSPSEQTQLLRAVGSQNRTGDLHTKGT